MVTNVVVVTNVITVTKVVTITNVVTLTNASALAGARVGTNAPSAKAAVIVTNRWQNSVTLGLTLARGNSDTTLASLSESSERSWARSRLNFGGDVLYGESKAQGATTSTETAESMHGFAQYNRILTPRSYAYGRVDALHDGIADIQYRLNLAPGLGYYFLTNKTADLSVELGPGCVFEKLDGSYREFASLRLAQRFHYRFNEHSRLWQTVEFIPSLNEFNDYVMTAELGLEAGLSKNNRLSLRTVLRDSYNNVPAAERLKNDLKLITGINYKF